MPPVVGSPPVSWATPAGRGKAAYGHLTSNYGEAGAVDRYGLELRLPRAYSGHNSYWWWSRPPDGTTTVVGVGFDRRYLQEFFRSVLPTGSLHNGAGVDDDEESAPVWICPGPRAPTSVPLARAAPPRMNGGGVKRASPPR